MMHQRRDELTSSIKEKQEIHDSKSEKKMPALERFRSIARSVQSQGRWTKDLQSKIAEEHSKEFKISQQADGNAEMLSFNVSGKTHFFPFVRT